MGPFQFVYLLAAVVAVLFVAEKARADGERGVVPEPEGYHASHPVMDTLARAGVVGGIPKVTHVKATLSPGANLQSAIDNGGPGVVLLNDGTYEVTGTIYLRKGVVLRGKNRYGVKLSVKMRSTSKKFAIQFDSNCRYAGLENLTVSYDAVSQNPIDRWGLDNGSYYNAAFQNNPHELNDLYVGLVRIDSTCNWVDSVDLLKGGTDPVCLAGWHNTVRSCMIDRSYNKGGDGNGYFDLRGDRNLVCQNTVRRIRHFSIQQNAEHNVVTGNRIEVDVNYHNGDAGQNLVEHNQIYKPSWHAWTVFSTGGAQYGHKPPGPNNIIFRNTTYDYSRKTSPFSEPSTSYTFTGFGQPVATTWPAPAGGKWYSVKYLPAPWSAGDIGGSGQSGFVSVNGSTWTIRADGADVWGTEDDCHYVWRPLVGDGEMTVEVQAQQNTHDWAKAGLMIREFGDSGSKQAMVCVTPGNGSSFMYRASTDQGSTAITPGDGQTAPAKLRITRKGSIIGGYVWRNNDWVEVGSATISMWSRAQIGFFACSHQTSTQGEVTFLSPSVDSSMSMTRSVFTPGEQGDPISVAFHGSPGNKTDTIAIYAEDETPAGGPSRGWRYLNNSQTAPGAAVESGIVTFPTTGLTPGNYYATMRLSGGTEEVSERIPFRIHFDSHPGEPPAASAWGAVLIDATHNNGSFELLNGVASTAKATHWDTDSDGDVTNWTHWGVSAGGPSSAWADSGAGVSSYASHGTRVAFLQPGNAVYNLVDHIIAEGDIFTFSFKWRRSGRGPLKGQLAYKDGSSIVAIEDTEFGGAALRTFWHSWTVPAGHPAIGRQIALTLATTGNYPEVDEATLHVDSPTLDADNDGMADQWEYANFDSKVRTGSDDADGDGTDDLVEYRLGLDPLDGSSRFAASLSVADADDPSGGFTVSWFAKAGVTFAVERSETMAEGSWSVIETVTSSVDGPVSVTDPDQTPSSRAFYRVKLEP